MEVVVAGSWVVDRDVWPRDREGTARNSAFRLQFFIYNYILKSEINATNRCMMVAFKDKASGYLEG